MFERPPCYLTGVRLGKLALGENALKIRVKNVSAKERTLRGSVVSTYRHERTEQADYKLEVPAGAEHTYELTYRIGRDGPCTVAVALTDVNGRSPHCLAIRRGLRIPPRVQVDLGQYYYSDERTVSGEVSLHFPTDDLLTAHAEVQLKPHRGPGSNVVETGQLGTGRGRVSVNIASLPPGRYVLTVTVRDADQSLGVGTAEFVKLPRFQDAEKTGK